MCGMQVDLAIEWQEAPGEGVVEARFGRILHGEFPRSEGIFAGGRFHFEGAGPCRLELSVDADHLGPGSQTTTITVRGGTHSFTFFVRDVGAAAPVWIRPYGVVVTLAADRRSYNELVAAITCQGRETGLRGID